MLRCGNTILLTVKFLDVAKFTTLIPCKLSFPVVGLQRSSLLTLALNSHKTVIIIIIISGSVSSIIVALQSFVGL
jgi:hypothetical protein